MTSKERNEGKETDKTVESEIANETKNRRDTVIPLITHRADMIVQSSHLTLHQDVSTLYSWRRQSLSFALGS